MISNRSFALSQSQPLPPPSSCPAYFGDCEAAAAPRQNISFSNISCMVGMVEANEVEFSLEEPWHAAAMHSEYSRGSGWFIRFPSEDPSTPVRFMLTCFHCVASSDYVRVVTASTGATKIRARVRAILPDIDAAVIELDKGDGFIAWQLGDDKGLDMGDALWVYGYPAGQSNLKVVNSSLNGRQDGGLQIDGAVNEGHSGGPVVARNGKVVGWVYGGIPDSNNICYAKPVSLLSALLLSLDRQVIQKDKKDTVIYRQRSIGLFWSPATTTLWEAIGGADHSGVMVTHILPRSPLAGAIQKGDLLCSISIPGYDQPILVDNDGFVAVPWAHEERYGLEDVFAYVEWGAACDLTFWSTAEGRLHTVDGVVPMDLSEHGTRHYYPPYDQPRYECFGGLVVCEISADIVKQFKLMSQGKLIKKQLEHAALVVVNILPGSLFQSGGTAISKGDILRSVNQRRTRTINEYRKAVRSPMSDGTYWFIKTIEGGVTVVRMDAVLRNERSLRRKYGYEALRVDYPGHRHRRAQSYHDTDSSDVESTMGSTESGTDGASTDTTSSSSSSPSLS